MRLAFLSPCFLDRHFGGVQLTARLACEALHDVGAGNMRFLCYRPNCAARKQSTGDAAIHHCSRSKAGAAFEALRNRAWPDRLLFWHADLLKLLPFIGARGRQKFLFLHGVECWRDMQPAFGRLLDQVDVFLSNSDFTWNRFAEMNPRWADARHRTVPLGVGAAEPISETPACVPAAIMIGRLSRREGYKGHKEVIAAWPRVLKMTPDAELWIVGGGDAAPDLRALAKESGAGANIRFFGVVSEEEKDRMLRESRCLLLPSRGEGFGLVYLEAMRAGRPCLTSTHDAGREVVRPPEAGLAVNAENAEQLADAITRLLAQSGEWSRWSVQARQRYESNFTAAHFQQRLLRAIYGDAA